MARPVRTLENSDWVWVTAFDIFSAVCRRMSSIIGYLIARGLGPS